MKAHKFPKLTVEEYIRHERDSGVKYEYHDGEIFAMAGGSYNHGLLCANIYSELRNGLGAEQGKCKPLSSEIKLFVNAKNSYVHPDCMVVCGEVEKSRNDKNAVSNPILVVEVLSKSTADYDRGDKFHLYRQMETLREYVLIDQYKHVVEVYYRPEKVDLWKITRYEGLGKIITFESIGLEIRMDALYFDIEFEA